MNDIKIIDARSEPAHVQTFNALCFGEATRAPIPVIRLGMPRGYKAEESGPVFTSWAEACAAMGWVE